MKSFVFAVATILFSAVSAAISDLPADYRSKTYTRQNPLVLEYRFNNRPEGLVRLKVINYPRLRSDLFFFHMHENEIAAKTTAEALVQKNGGTFMYLDHAGTSRNMKAPIDNITYEFDPNRIYTDKGLRERTRPIPTPDHFRKLKHFVDWIERNILLARQQRKFQMVIALHNNTDDDAHGRLLSILTEKENPDNLYTNVNPQWDIDNFYITTIKAIYDRLIEANNPNISLIGEHPRDIGYLSNWAINRRIEFITVEAQQGDLVSNRRMVELVQSLHRR